MNSNNEITKLRREIDERLSKIERLATLPEEPEAGSVVKFSKVLGGTTYTYAAIHVNGGWYLTGRETRRRNWQQLVEFAGDTQIRVVSDYQFNSLTPTPVLNEHRINSAKLEFNPSSYRTYFT